MDTKLAGKANSSHNHAASEITSGTLAVARGGSGLTASPSMLTNLGSTTAASVFAASPRPGVTGTLPVANGGTGATDAATARSNLGITLANIGAAASSHNHAASNITSGTLAVARGGTGVTSNPSLLVNLGSTSAASVFAASPRPGVTGTLPVANGGTGTTSLAGLSTALNNLEWTALATYSGTLYNKSSVTLLAAGGVNLDDYGDLCIKFSGDACFRSYSDGDGTSINLILSGLFGNPLMLISLSNTYGSSMKTTLTYDSQFLMFRTQNSFSSGANPYNSSYNSASISYLCPFYSSSPQSVGLTSTSARTNKNAITLAYKGQYVDAYTDGVANNTKCTGSVTIYGRKKVLP